MVHKGRYLLLFLVCSLVLFIQCHTIKDPFAQMCNVLDFQRQRRLNSDCVSRLALTFSFMENKGQELLSLRSVCHSLTARLQQELSYLQKTFP